ncbi:MAG: hypothetical protein ACLFVJ_19295 [Persicimonas sp.]
MADLTQTALRITRGAVAGVVATFAMKRITSLLESRQRSSPAVGRGFRPRKPAERALVDRMNKRFGWGMSRRKRRKVSKRVKWALGATTGIANAWLRRRVGATDSLLRAAALGALTFLLADEVLKPALGVGIKPTKLPWPTHATALAGHATYGLVNAGVRRMLEEKTPLNRRTFN